MMKKLTLITLLSIFSFGLSAQEKFQVYQEGFGKNAVLNIQLNGGSASRKTDKELIFEVEGNPTKPNFGLIGYKNKIARFYIEPGAMKVIVKKKGFPSSLEVPGSKSHEIYHSLNFAKNKTEFYTLALNNISDSIALETFDKKFTYHKLEIEELEHFYSLVANENKRFLANLKAYLNIHGIEKIIPGSNIYDFSASDKNDQVYSTKDYRGKFLLIDFSATWCGPCWKGYPDLIEEQSKYENLQVLTFNFDDDILGWDKMATHFKIKLNWPVLWKSPNKKEVFDIYNLDGFPSFILVSPEGKVLEKWFGNGKAKLRKKLSKHLKEPSASER